jgi:hypothetical protein
MRNDVSVAVLAWLNGPLPQTDRLRGPLRQTGRLRGALRQTDRRTAHVLRSWHAARGAGHLVHMPAGF